MNNADAHMLELYSAFPVPSPPPYGYHPPPGVVTCWTGEGAGLNDPNGQERDYYGRYLRGWARCHLVISNGVESYGSKRPEVSGIPRKVKDNSPSVWRPVAIGGVAIAN